MKSMKISNCVNTFQTILVIFAVLLPATLHARIGETEDEITKRFGKEEEERALDRQDREKINKRFDTHLLDRNAAMAFRELKDALHWSIGQETRKFMDMLSEWNWDRVTFRCYQFGEFKVHVILLDNKSVFEHYQRYPDLNEQEVDTLLTSNAGGSKWEKIAPPPDSGSGSTFKKWKIVDPTTRKPSRLAISNGGTQISFFVPEIVLYCTEAAKTIAEEKEKKRKDGIKGF